MITKLKLQNFKCFDDIEIPFSDLTLLAGSNGSGKSTIIQALLLIAQSYHHSDNSFIYIELMGKHVKLGHSNDVLYEFANEQNLRLNLEFEDWSINLNSIFESQKTQMKIEPEVRYFGTLSLNKDGLLVAATGLLNDRFEYIAADRISPDKVFSIFKCDDNLGIHGENVMNYLNRYGRKPINTKLCVEGVGDELVLQLDYWLSKLFNGFCVSFKEIFQAETINLRFQEINQQDKSNERRPINVGFGIAYTLPVLVALLKAQPGDLVIIENPESHLHPKAQRLIGEIIARVVDAGVQLIIETHSDHVLNGIRLAVKRKLVSKEKIQILFTAREDVGKKFHTNVFAPKILDNGDLDVWPEGFFDEWDNALINLLE